MQFFMNIPLKAVLTTSVTLISLVLSGCDSTSFRTLIQDPFAAFAVNTVTPNNGPLAGNTRITIRGASFLPGNISVTLDGVTCTSVQYVSEKELNCIAPAHAAGAVTIEVLNPNAISTISLGKIYTYNPLPTVSSISPTNGPTSGGTAIQIAGTGFLSQATVLIDGLACTSIQVVSSSLITCNTPSECRSHQHRRTIRYSN
jgi:hypothetical protein